MLAGYIEALADEQPSATAGRQTVRLVVDYHDGVEKHFTDISWKKGITVFDLLQLAKNHPHGIAFRSTGSGATLFVTSIDGLNNQGGGPQDKNWIYSINGKKGTRSCAVQDLKAGDIVQWTYDIVKL